MSALAALVDAMLDHARSSHPGAEWTITLDVSDALRLPKDSDKLFREVDGRLGYYRGHVYRDGSRPAEPCPAPACRRRRPTRRVPTGRCARRASDQSDCPFLLPHGTA